MSPPSQIAAGTPRRPGFATSHAAAGYRRAQRCTPVSPPRSSSSRQWSSSPRRFTRGVGPVVALSQNQDATGISAPGTSSRRYAAAHARRIVDTTAGCRRRSPRLPPLPHACLPREDVATSPSHQVTPFDFSPSALISLISAAGNVCRHHPAHRQHRRRHVVARDSGQSSRGRHAHRTPALPFTARETMPSSPAQIQLHRHARHAGRHAVADLTAPAPPQNAHTHAHDDVHLSITRTVDVPRRTSNALSSKIPSR